MSDPELEAIRATRGCLLACLLGTIAWILLLLLIRLGFDAVSVVPSAAAVTPSSWSRVDERELRPLPAVAPENTPTAQPTPSASAARKSTPAPTPRSTPLSYKIAGLATWYDDGPGLYAAAGPALRRALGAHWRDRIVTVCGRVCVSGVRLSDWCACRNRHGKPTVLDLSLFTFARIGPPSRGVIEVIVSW